MQARLKTHFAARALTIASALVLACAAGATQAAVLAGTGPYLGAINGTQNDAGTPTLTLNFSAPANATLQEIVWWGYRLNAAPGGPYADDFSVMLDAFTQTGTLTTSVVATLSGVDLVRYSLDVADTALTASSISIASQALDFEWYWQGINALPDGNSGFRPAFNLIGTVNTNTVPEPGSLALVALAGLALLAARRRSD